jgi:hypothetical protein
VVVTDAADALSLDDLGVPWLVAEVPLAPGAVFRADWRTAGIPLLTAEQTGCAPMLEVESGGRRLVVGFDPHEVLGVEHATLAGQLAAAARALALEVGLLVQGRPMPEAAPEVTEEDERSPWATHVHLRPDGTRVRMEPCEGDVPWLDIVCGEASCSVSFDVPDVRELGPAHAAVAEQLAAVCEAFAADVRGVVAAADGVEGLRPG